MVEGIAAQGQTRQGGKTSAGSKTGSIANPVRFPQNRNTIPVLKRALVPPLGETVGALM